MLRILALNVFLLAPTIGCSPVPADMDNATLVRHMSARGWIRDTRMDDRATVVPLAQWTPVDSPYDLVDRAAAAWGVGPRKIRRIIKTASGLETSRLDLLAAAGACSEVPIGQLVSVMEGTIKEATARRLSFSDHLAMVAALAMFDPEPHRVRYHFRSALDGLASASLPDQADPLDIAGRIQFMDRWRRSHKAGTAREASLDSMVPDPIQRRSVVLLLQDSHMVVFCDLVGRFGCSRGLTREQVGFYPQPDGVQRDETWRATEISRNLLKLGDR